MMKRYEELPRWKRGIIGAIMSLAFYFLFSSIENHTLHTMIPFLLSHWHMPDNIVEAAESDSVSQVQKFLDSGADANSMEDEYDRTPLSVAVDNGNASMIRLLLAHGADAYKLAQSEESSMSRAISYACFAGKEASVRALIEYGVDVNGKDPETGFTPLHELVVWWGYRHHPKDLFLLLLSKGADVNARDKKGIRPLGYAVGKDRADIAQLLKDHGAKM